MLQPVKTFPSAVRNAAPTRKFENGASEHERASVAIRIRFSVSLNSSLQL